MLKINLEELFELPERKLVKELKGVELDIPTDDGEKTVKISSGTIKVEMKSFEELEVSGEFKFSISLVCSRCLSSFKRDFHVEFFVRFLEASRFAPAGDVELNDELLEVQYFSGVEIDLTPVLRDSAALVLPMKPLCKPDCKGLCPICGKNLNEGPCSCKIQEHASSPFSALISLKKKLEGSDGGS